MLNQPARSQNHPEFQRMIVVFWLMPVMLVLVMLLPPGQNQAVAAPMEPVPQQWYDELKWVSTRIRCLECDNESVWHSNTESALNTRQEIIGSLEAGESPQAILDQYVESYGVWILTRPPKRGVYGLAWVLPFAALVGVFGLYRYYLRRGGTSASGGSGGSGPEGPGDAGPGELDESVRQRLEEEIRSRM